MPCVLHIIIYIINCQIYKHDTHIHLFLTNPNEQFFSLLIAGEISFLENIPITMYNIQYVLHVCLFYLMQIYFRHFVNEKLIGSKRKASESHSADRLCLSLRYVIFCIPFKLARSLQTPNAYKIRYL